jgi:hypothetical protein
VWSGGRGARIAKTPEDAKTVIGRRCTEEKVVRSVVPTRTTRTDVDETGSSGKSIRPKPGGHVRVKE